MIILNTNCRMFCFLKETSDGQMTPDGQMTLDGRTPAGSRSG